MDSPAENAAFRTKFEFPFPLLCDEGGALSRAYGAAGEGDRNAGRAAVIVGPDGNVVKWWAKVDARTFPETALAELP